MTYLLVALSYVAGSIPSSFLVGKIFHGIDLRQHGSGNLGATNAFRVLGAKSALPVLLADMTKGLLPVLFFPRLAPAAFGWTLAYAGAAILGHMFSVWVGFRGGKGIATSAGVLIALAPWAVLGGLFVWLAVTFPSGYVSLGSIAAAAALPALVALTPHQGGATLVWFCLILGAVVIWAHRKNIRRLARGEEHRFGRRAGGEAGAPRSGDWNA
ncbi:MAG: glycerol-3-phosphate 1-O-acyltransferase PlsY [Gemmatimonadales bacterium]